jgi:hypothetical protein
MRISIDIPGEMHRRLKVKAQFDRCSMREVVVCTLDRELAFVQVKSSRKRHRIKPPLIKSKRPGTLKVDNNKIFEIMPFP